MLKNQSQQRWVLLEKGLFSEVRTPIRRFNPVRAIYKERPLIAIVQVVPVHIDGCSFTFEVELIENLVRTDPHDLELWVGKKWEVMAQGKFDSIRDTVYSSQCGWEIDFREDVLKDFVKSVQNLVRSEKKQELYSLVLNAFRNSQSKIDDAFALTLRQQRRKDAEMVQSELKRSPKIVHMSWIPTLTERPVYEESGKCFYYEQGHRIFLSKIDSDSLNKM